jgi:hypothetical protein
MEREITEIDAEINAALDCFDKGMAKLGALPEHINIEGWEELCEAKEMLERLPWRLSTE